MKKHIKTNLLRCAFFVSIVSFCSVLCAMDSTMDSTDKVNTKKISDQKNSTELLADKIKKLQKNISSYINEAESSLDLSASEKQKKIDSYKKVLKNLEDDLDATYKKAELQNAIYQSLGCNIDPNNNSKSHDKKVSEREADMLLQLDGEKLLLANKIVEENFDDPSKRARLKLIVKVKDSAE